MFNEVKVYTKLVGSLTCVCGGCSWRAVRMSARVVARARERMVIQTRRV